MIIESIINNIGVISVLLGGGFTYLVDYKNWNNGGHCVASINK